MPDFRNSLPPKTDHLKHFAKESAPVKLKALRWVMLRDVAVAIGVPVSIYLLTKFWH